MKLVISLGREKNSVSLGESMSGSFDDLIHEGNLANNVFQLHLNQIRLCGIVIPWSVEIVAEEPSFDCARLHQIGEDALART